MEKLIIKLIFSHGPTAPSGPGPSHYRGFTITLRHITFGRTPLDERSVRRTHLYLIAHNTHKSQTSKPPAWSEPAIPASEQLWTHALDGAATGIGLYNITGIYWDIKIVPKIHGIRVGHFELNTGKHSTLHSVQHYTVFTVSFILQSHILK
jgi:hypothetical protein